MRGLVLVLCLVLFDVVFLRLCASVVFSVLRLRFCFAFCVCCALCFVCFWEKPKIRQQCAKGRSSSMPGVARVQSSVTPGGAEL